MRKSAPKTMKKVQEVARAAARETLREAEARDERLHEDEEVNLPFSLGVENTVEAPRDPLAIFDDATALMNNGEICEIRITRNGAFCGVKYPPYDLKNLQEEFGGGFFKISLKSTSSGHFKGNSTFSVAAAPKPLPAEPVDDDREEKAAHAAPAATNPLLEALALMTQLQAPARAAAEQAAREAQTQQNRMTEILVAALKRDEKPVSKDPTLEIMRMVTDAQKEMAGMLKDALREMRGEISEVKRDRKGADEGLKATDLLRMEREAEERGYKRGSEIYKLAAEQTQREVARIESMREEVEETGGVKPKSMTDSLIEAALPIMTAVGRQQMQQVAAATVPPPVQPARVAPVNRPQVARPRVVAPTAAVLPKSPPTRAPASNQAGSKPGGFVKAAPEKSAAVGDFGSAVKPVPQKTAVPVVSNMRERVLELAIPVIGEAIGKYPDHPKAELAAAETLKAFHGQGISALTATKALTREDFWSIIQETGLKGRDDLWFNTYYDCLEQKALSKSSGSNGPGATA